MNGLHFHSHLHQVDTTYICPYIPAHSRSSSNTIPQRQVRGMISFILSWFGSGREVRFLRAGRRSVHSQTLCTPTSWGPLPSSGKKDGGPSGKGTWGEGCGGEEYHFPFSNPILSPNGKGSSQLLFTAAAAKPREVEEPTRGHTGLLTPCPVLCLSHPPPWLHTGTLRSAGAQFSEERRPQQPGTAYLGAGRS